MIEPVLSRRSRAPRAHVAPVNVVRPSITGDATTLFASPGEWRGFPLPTPSYAWRRNGVVVQSGISAAYTLTGADHGATIDVLVTATNAGGTAEALSDPFAIPSPTPGDALLFEDGAAIAFEEGQRVALESTPLPPSLTLESGAALALETGGRMLLEAAA